MALWMKLHVDMLDDARVQRLPDPVFRTWINLQLLVKLHDQDGMLPDLETIAFRLRLDDGTAREHLGLLEARGLLEGDTVAGWATRQAVNPQDPSGADRQRRFRERERERAIMPIDAQAERREGARDDAAPTVTDSVMQAVMGPSRNAVTPTVTAPSRNAVTDESNGTELELEKENIYTHAREAENREEETADADFPARVFRELEKANGFFLPMEIGAFRASFYRDCAPFVASLDPAAVLDAIRNLGTIASAPPGRYFWDRKVTVRNFFEKHLVRFLPGAFDPENFVIKTRARKASRLDQERPTVEYQDLRGRLPDPPTDQDRAELEAMAGGSWERTFLRSLRGGAVAAVGGA